MSSAAGVLIVWRASPLAGRPREQRWESGLTRNPSDSWVSPLRPSAKDPKEASESSRLMRGPLARSGLLGSPGVLQVDQVAPFQLLAVGNEDLGAASGDGSPRARLGPLLGRIGREVRRGLRVRFGCCKKAVARLRLGKPFGRVALYLGHRGQWCASQDICGQGVVWRGRRRRWKEGVKSVLRRSGKQEVGGWHGSRGGPSSRQTDPY